MASKSLSGLYTCIPSPWRRGTAFAIWFALSQEVNEALNGTEELRRAPRSHSLGIAMYLHAFILSIFVMISLIMWLELHSQSEIPMEKTTFSISGRQKFASVHTRLGKTTNVFHKNLHSHLSTAELLHVCVCFSCLHIWLRCSCAAQSSWGVWDGLSPPLSPSSHCWQLFVKPLLKGLCSGETQSLPKDHTPVLHCPFL